MVPLGWRIVVLLVFFLSHQASASTIEFVANGLNGGSVAGGFVVFVAGDFSGVFGDASRWSITVGGDPCEHRIYWSTKTRLACIAPPGMEGPAAVELTVGAVKEQFELTFDPQTTVGLTSSSKSTVLIGDALCASVQCCKHARCTCSVRDLQLSVGVFFADKNIALNDFGDNVEKLEQFCAEIQGTPAGNYQLKYSHDVLGSASLANPAVMSDATGKVYHLSVRARTTQAAPLATTDQGGREQKYNIPGVTLTTPVAASLGGVSATAVVTEPGVVTVTTPASPSTNAASRLGSAGMKFTDNAGMSVSYHGAELHEANIAGKLEGVFTPPHTGDYKFHVSRTGAVTVTISSWPAKAPLATVAALAEGKTNFRDFFASTSTASVALTASMQYFLSVAFTPHTNTAEVSHVTVGYEVSNVTPAVAGNPENFLPARIKLSTTIQPAVVYDAWNLPLPAAFTQTTKFYAFILRAGVNPEVKEFTFAACADLNDLACLCTALTSVAQQQSTCVGTLTATDRVLQLTMKQSDPTRTDFILATDTFSSSNRVSYASPAIQGTFDLTSTAGKGTVTISADANIHGMSSKIRKLVGGSPRCYRVANIEGGVDWVCELWYASADASSIDVGSTALTPTGFSTGTSVVNAAATYTILSAESRTTLMSFPILTDFLVAEEPNPQMQLTVNGVRALCNCPVVVSAAPTIIPVLAGSNLQISTSAGAIPAGTTVDIAGLRYTPTVAGTTATLDVSALPVGGTLPVRLVDPSLGFSQPATVTFATPTVTASAVSVGGTKGASLTGNFVAGAMVSVTVNGVAAANVVAGATTITFDSPLLTTAAGATVPVVASWTQNGVAVSVSATSTLAAGPTYATITPTVGSLYSPTTYSVSGASLSGATSVHIGQVPCSIVENTAALVRCTTAYGDPGSQDVLVLVGSHFAHNNKAYLTVSNDFTVTSISPAAGSIHGGQTVNIAGTGFFSQIPSFSGYVLIGDKECTLQSVSSNSISCTTPPGAAPTTTAQVVVRIPRNTGWVLATGTVTYEYKGASTYAYEQAAFATPTAPGKLTLRVKSAGATLTAQTTVVVGGKPCTVTSFAAAEIQCLAEYDVAGDKTLVVSDPAVGVAAGQQTVAYPLALLGVAPTTVNANGQVYVLTGAGFPADTAGVSLAVNGKALRIVHSSHNTVFALLTAADSTAVIGASIALAGTVGAVPVQATTLTAAPTAAPTKLDSVTYNGLTTATVAGFGLDGSTLFLASGASAAISGITASVGTLPVGKHLAVAAHADTGLAVSATDLFITVAPSISVSPTAGSVEGGAVLTVSGSFSPTQALTTVELCGKPCAISAASYTATGFECTAPANPAGSCEVRVSSGGATAVAAAPFAYTVAATPVVNSVTPAAGSSQGGEQITISGSNLLGATVKVDGVSCAIDSATATQVKCTTGFRRIGSTGGFVVTTAAGLAQLNAVFAYRDLWSSPTTWGGLPPPREGESVSIPAGMHIILDVPRVPLLKAVVIQGVLEFKNDVPFDIEFNAHFVLVQDGGHLIVGKEGANNHFKGKATIVLHGRRSDVEAPIYGTKVLAVRRGTLDLHGKPVVATWTRLAADAAQGANTLVVSKNVADWPVGSQIVVAPSSWSHLDAETHVITAVSYNANTGLSTITLAGTLSTYHLGSWATDSGNTQVVDMRAEVGLLSRNVIFQGDDVHTQADQLGAHIMLHDPDGQAVGRIEHIEARNVGQAFRLGRYPIHYHLLGDVSTSYIRNSAIHHSFNRAVTIHGVTNLRVEGNVAYDVMGHTFFIEDGIETKNILRNNLAVLTRASHSLLDTDTTPASFWITNPDNTIEGNAAAGSERYGFWVDLPVHPSGPSSTSTVCPQGTPLLSFSDNSAHSNGRYGLRVFDRHIPRQDPCNWGSAPVQSVYRNFHSYRNVRTGLKSTDNGWLVFRNIFTADNIEAGIEIQDLFTFGANAAMLDTAVIVGNSGLVSSASVQTAQGMIFARNDGLVVRNVKMVNFHVATLVAWGTCSKCSGPTEDTGARTTFVSGVTYDNVPVGRRLKFSYPFKAIIRDMDGSFLAQAPPTPAWLSNGALLHLRVPACTLVPATVIGPDSVIKCPDTHPIRRVAIYDKKPDRLNWLQVKITNPGGQASFIDMQKKHDPNLGWAFPLVTQYRYALDFHDPANPTTTIDFNSFVLGPNRFFQAASQTDALILRFAHFDFRDHYNVAVRQGTNTERFAALSLANHSHGDFFHDTTAKALFVLVGAPQFVEVQGSICPRTGCVVTTIPVPTGDIHLWSDTAFWEPILGSKRLPGAADDLVIPVGKRVLVNVATVEVKYLRVDGELIVYDDSAACALNCQTSVTLSAYWVHVQGQFTVGKPTYPLPATRTFTLRLLGTRDDPQLQSVGIAIPPSSSGTNFSLLPGNKVLAVYGNLYLVGAAVTPWGTLALDADVNANSLELTAAPAGWKAGDRIIVTSTAYSMHQTEEAVVDSVAGALVTLRTPLKHRHRANLSRVGLLTRNIHITGVVSGTNTHKASVLVAKAQQLSSGTITLVEGKADVQYAEFSNMGPLQTDRAGVRFIASKTASLRGSSIHSCDNVGLNVVDVAAAVVDSNVVHDTLFSGVRVDGPAAMKTDITNNLVGHSRDPPSNSDMQVDSYASIEVCMYSDCAAVAVRSNVAFGSEDAGLALRPDLCTTANADLLVTGNTASSSETGILLYPRDGILCGRLHGFMGFKNHMYGVQFFGPANADLSGLILADNVIGVNVNNANRGFDALTVNIHDSDISGVSPGECADLDNGCASPSVSGPAKPCNTVHGIMAAGFPEHSKPYPLTHLDTPWHNIKKETAFGGRVTVTNVVFRNFKQAACPAKSVRIFATNPTSPDKTSAHYFTGCSTVDSDPQSALFHEPNPGWANGDDCGLYTCTGLNQALAIDVSGGLFGAAGAALTLLNGNVATIGSGCTAVASAKAWSCAGANYGLLVFESLDEDRLKRRLDPVTVTSLDTTYPYTNTLNTYMDHGWDHDYTSLLRLSRFPAAVRLGTPYKIAFTGTEPNILRFQVQYPGVAAPGVLVQIKYVRPQLLTLVKEQDPSDTGSAVSVPVAANPIIGGTAVLPSLTSPTGTHVWESRTSTLSFILRTSEMVRVQMEDAVVVTLTTTATVQQFYDVNSSDGSAFLDALALLFGFPANSWRLPQVFPVSKRNALAETRVVLFFACSNADSKIQCATKLADAKTKLEVTNAFRVLGLDYVVVSAELSVTIPEYVTIAPTGLVAGFAIVGQPVRYTFTLDRLTCADLSINPGAADVVMFVAPGPSFRETDPEVKSGDFVTDVCSPNVYVMVRPEDGKPGLTEFPFGLTISLKPNPNPASPPPPPSPSVAPSPAGTPSPSWTPFPSLGPNASGGASPVAPLPSGSAPSPPNPSLAPGIPTISASASIPPSATPTPPVTPSTSTGVAVPLPPLDTGTDASERFLTIGVDAHSFGALLGAGTRTTFFVQYRCDLAALAIELTGEACVAALSEDFDIPASLCPGDSVDVPVACDADRRRATVGVVRFTLVATEAQRVFGVVVRRVQAVAPSPTPAASPTLVIDEEVSSGSLLRAAPAVLLVLLASLALL
mmetsp:Transcript_4311/g.10607  ORF Transcript_4311/g.10607 Transcript_4311/m.10607 type:complete len:3581 (-) Transcript_4311:97-10839(-)